jgi:hypothetical protein
MNDALKHLHQVFEQELAEDANKSTEQLLAEFDPSDPNERILTPLVERGQRDVLLARCSNAEQRESIWYEFLSQTLAKELIERGTPAPKEEVENALTLVRENAGILSMCEPLGEELLARFTTNLLSQL